MNDSWKYPVPGMAEMGMVWMGAQQAAGEVPMGLIPPDTPEMLLEHQDQDSVYYTNQPYDSINHDDNMMHYLNMKHDEYGYDEETGQQVYMCTTSTQTQPCPQRKIKPVKHPGLVLKTPIAYQGNTDPSVIPIQKDGIAVCEKCGAIGVKHAFYTRERRFCSMACARGYSGLIPEPLPQNHPDMPDSKHHFARYKFSTEEEPEEEEEEFSKVHFDYSRLPQLQRFPMAFDDTVPLVRRTKLSDLAHSFSWDVQLNDRYFVAAPVTCFKHAPMADIWENIMVGMKVEVENTDVDNLSDTFPDSFWVATVMRIVGYKAQLRYEGFGANDSRDFWVILCSNQVHPVGWCATRGKPLIPPRTIENKYNDWKDFLRKRLTGARTLPTNFSLKTSESMKSRFCEGLTLEVVDRNHISQVKVAVIHKIVGKRLNIKYFDMPPEDEGFWCHEDSPLLHPVGWAKKVGHNLVAPPNYIERTMHCMFDEEDATDALFNPLQVGNMDFFPGFAVGMKLEAIDPLNLSAICAATVMDVLTNGYIMIRIDSYEPPTNGRGGDWFCYHVKSPCIFPVGFCQKHNIPLTPPKGYESSTFDWNTYICQTGTTPADPFLFNTYVPLHGFVPGMKIEAADLMDPKLICIATVGKVVGRLLKVHFDGWEDEYDQWLDCESSDIYPVGWCQSVGHKLEGPPQAVVPVQKPLKAKKRSRKKKVTKHNSSTQSSKMELDVLDNFEDDQSMSTRSEISEEHHGPETGEEPLGPDQNLPVATVEPAMPVLEQMDVKQTQPVEEPPEECPKLVPVLAAANVSLSSDELYPNEWNVDDVAEFLRVNECQNYCHCFSDKGISGKMLLELSKEDILDYTGGKVGPSLKIWDLIQQLKYKVNKKVKKIVPH